jgi:hypothetical protein
MSEPYCVLLRAQITRKRVAEYLLSTTKPAATYDDWTKCTGFIDVASVADRMDAWLVSLDARTGATYGDAFQAYRRQAMEPSFFRFYYDDTHGVLHQASLLYAQGASELVAHLCVARGIGEFLRDDETGIIAVHDPFIGNGTAGAISLAAGQSQVVDIDAQVEAKVGAMVAELPTLASLENDKGRDELDTFLS